MGSGKSTIGRQLAKKLHRKFFDSDREIEKRTGVSISWIFEMEGEEGFREREQKVIDELSAMDNIVMALEHNDKNIFGIMWHCERERPFKIEDKKLLNYVFN